MHGSSYRRMVAQLWHNDLRERVATWAANPRTSPDLIRRAVEDVTACKSLAPSEIDTLKLEYLDMERMLVDPRGPGAQMPPDWMRPLLAGKPGQGPIAFITPEQMQSIGHAWRSWRREPERSRRVIRLLVANVLAYYEIRPEDRPKPDLEASSLIDIYAFGSSMPAKARVLSPQVLGRWLESTQDAQILLRMLDLRAIRMREWANQSELLILLGTELYRRDHGKDPPSPEALVGPYLKSLPAEFPDDGRDQAVPITGKAIE
jgi:hypothetical protein